MIPRPPISTLLPSTTLFRSSTRLNSSHVEISYAVLCLTGVQTCALDRKSTRLNSSHVENSYAVFCLKNVARRRFGREQRVPACRFVTRHAGFVDRGHLGQLGRFFF